MPRQNQTSVKLSKEELLRLIEVLEGHLNRLISEEQLAASERVLKRLYRALDRV